MIKNKKDFKNCYIDLSNKELNGEVTEESIEKLKKCFQDIGFNVHRWDSETFGDYIHSFGTNDFIGKYSSISASDFDNSEFPDEVSIYDIQGMEDKAMKKKYTLEQLKNEKIAIHLPTQEERDICMKFFDKAIENSMNLKYFANFTNSYDYIEALKKQSIPLDLNQIFFIIKLTGNNYIITSKLNKDSIDKDYTIITLDDLDMGEDKITNNEELSAKKVDKWKLNDNDWSVEVSFIDKDNTKFKQAIVRYKDKEKVITREDFESDIDVENKYKVGSRTWAIDMVFSKQRKLRHTSYPKGRYINSTKVDQLLLYFEDGTSDFFTDVFYEDGWELYEEESKKTKILKDAVIDQETFMWKNKVTSPNEYWRISHEEFYNNLFLEVELINKE